MNAHIVNEDIDGDLFSRQFSEEPIGSARSRDVCNKRLMPPFIFAQLILNLFASLFINICQEDIRSLSSHLDRDASPDVSSGPGNENIFASQQLVQYVFLQRHLYHTYTFDIHTNFVDGCASRDV